MRGKRYEIHLNIRQIRFVYLNPSKNYSFLYKYCNN